MGGEDNVNHKTAKIVRISGLALPIVLTAYGLLIHFDIIHSAHYVSLPVFIGLMTVWLCAALFQYLFDSKRRIESAIRLTLYHGLAMAYMLFVSGFSMPFLVMWIVLILFAYAFFGSYGAKFSLAACALALGIDVMVQSHNYDVVINDLLSLVSMLFVGIVTIALSHVRMIDAGALVRSRKQESLQRDRTLTIINNLADAVLSTDEKGVVTVFNAASLNLLDTNVNLNGKKLDDILKLYDEEDKPFSLTKQLSDAKGVVIRDDLTMHIGEDEKLRLETTYSPIRSSYIDETGKQRHDGYIIIMRDVTKTKSLEEERDEFISVVSHELRTPITIAEGIISNLQVMLDKGIASQSKTKEGIDGAHDQVLFLARMVNDLSTLSRAERGVADESELINVRELANGMFGEYSSQADEKNLHFNLDMDTNLGNIMASRLYVEELLQNFITNAIKYTTSGSITFEVRRKKDDITFSVRDTGIGISKSDQVKIFEKFYRAEDYRTRETNGTGLGLYVAGKLARKLNTEIKLSSRLNHGSTFSFTLPVADVAEETKK